MRGRCAMTAGRHSEEDDQATMPRDRTLPHAARRPARPGRRCRPIHRRISLPRTLDREAFLGVLSHELRTPVTTIYGGAQILATRELPAGRRRALAADVCHEAERLYRIVEDLVVLLRAERGDLAPAREPVALGRLVAAAVERELGRNPELQIRYMGASDATADEADEELLMHVVRNLLDNATRNAAGGSPIEVVVETEGDKLVVRVLDRGSEPTDQGRQGAIDPAGTRAGLAGGGLGLFVAARLVEAMAGRSWARGRDGGGAEFGFALRRTPVPGAIAPA